MYQKLLVPVDGSTTSNRGLEEAISLAKLTGGSVRLVHVVDELSFSIAAGSYGGYTGDLLEVLREGGAEILEQAKKTVAAAGLPVETVLHETLTGSVADMVTTEAAKSGADLIVLGTHGRRGVGRMILGSSAESILRYAPVPVLLVRSPDVKPVKAAKKATHDFIDPVRVNLTSGGNSIE